MTQFDSVVTKLLIADGGTLGKFVFSGDYMFSEDGVYNDETKSYTWAIENGHFNISSTGEFTDWVPKFYVNQKTGDLVASNVKLSGEINATSGKFIGEGSFCNELVEFNSDGTGHIGAYDEDLETYKGISWNANGDVTINKSVVTGITVCEGDTSEEKAKVNLAEVNSNIYITPFTQSCAPILNLEFTYIYNTSREWIVYSNRSPFTVYVKFNSASPTIYTIDVDGTVTTQTAEGHQESPLAPIDWYYYEDTYGNSTGLDIVKITMLKPGWSMSQSGDEVLIIQNIAETDSSEQ